MPEYIEREWLLDLYEESKLTEKEKSYGVPFNIVRQNILDAPAVDAAPVVHGRWFYHDDGVITCSECGNAESSDSYYCRYCGAKMDGGADNG